MFEPSLSEPRAKRDRPDQVLQQQFPVPIGSLSEVKPNDAIWRWYHGLVQPETGLVQVHDSDEARTLCSMGFFGVRKKALEEDDGGGFVRIEDVVPSIGSAAEEVELSKTREMESERRREAKFRNDDDDDRPLELTPCEAFFLSYALGCLVVRVAGDVTKGKKASEDLSLDEMWATFCRADPDFPYMYRVYHHFRSKGWVVKSGVKFGVDFLLYKHGPAFFHASYSVRVQVEGAAAGNDADDADANSQGSKLCRRRSFTWRDLACLNRVTESAAKELLLAKVRRPEKLGAAELAESIGRLKKLRVDEVLVRRWVPKQEREEL